MKLFIHRKDLRTSDLPALDYIAASGEPAMHALFLDPFLLRGDRHLEHSGAAFLRAAGRLEAAYKASGRRLNVYYGEPARLLRQLLGNHPQIGEVVVHADHTPYAIARDRELQEASLACGASFTALPDRSLVPLRDFHLWTGRQAGYKVFTPFYQRWRAYLEQRYTSVYALRLQDAGTADAGALPGCEVPEGFAAVMRGAHSSSEPSAMQRLEQFLNDGLQDYAAARDDYGVDGTSRMSAFLSVGEISARAAYEAASSYPSGIREAWLRQLAWRDFYLYQSLMDPGFFNYERKFDLSALDDRHFAAWRDGVTGVPIIDAAMNQLNATGWMPNRLRMITAMFLTKNLRCPFVYGERYFRRKLADYDNTQNRGGWLWASSLGFDAAPYFRIMNPVSQSKRYDPEGHYLRKWLPQARGASVSSIHEPAPGAIIDLRQSRLDAIIAYKSILSRTNDEPDGHSSPLIDR